MAEEYRLPDDYLLMADEFMPFTIEKAIGTFQHTWEIDSWSTITQHTKFLGPTFQTGDCAWNVLLYPNGNNVPDQISLYLENADMKNETRENDICAQVMLCIVHPKDPTKFVRQVFQHRFSKYEPDRGYSNFLDLKMLMSGTEKGGPLVIDDAVKIVVIVRLFEDPMGVLWHNFIGYDSKEVTGYVGLFNQGATCYMNSLFQSLFFTNFYRKAVYQIPTENDDPHNSIALALQRLFYNLQFSKTAVSTIELTTSFGWNSIDSFMQHDVQEFNRLLQDSIEKKMRGTPANDSIKQLFVGRMKSYIKCLNVDYESSRSEDFYDIQLNVKGCKDLLESFKTYISEEILEGDNKYMASGHGLQDAKKGVIFESFPPVIHLQLKRFEYDMMKDSMVKINDRHEFPDEIDLEPFLSDSADRSESHKYALHGVLVHTGDLSGGHYFAFVRPTQENKWFKFDDDRVTPASLNQVFEDNFGGETKNVHPTYKPVKRFTNAYMLVYIRKSRQDQILEDVTQKDIPAHLVERICQEQEALKMLLKQREEQHLYVQVFIASDASFLSNTGAQWIPVVDHESMPAVQSKVALKTQTLRQLLEEYATEFGARPEHLRLWNLANRKNGNVQLDSLFSDADLDLSIEEVCRPVPNYPFLRVYVETASNGFPLFPLPNSNAVLVFIKLFDPISQSLRGVGRLYVTRNSQIGTIVNSLNQMVGFQTGTILDVYEVIYLETLVLALNWTFDDYKIGNGDILCFQEKLSEERIEYFHAKDMYSNAPDYLLYLYNRITVFFAAKDDPFNAFPVALRQDMLYEDVARQLALILECDPNYLLLVLPDCYGHPKKAHRQVKFTTLSDLLMLIPQQKNTNDDVYVPRLYFELLPISRSEYETKKLIRLNFCSSALNQIQVMNFYLPKLARISSLLSTMKTQNPMRIFQVVDHKLVKVFTGTEIIPDDESDLFAETIPEEESNMGEDDFYISVYHYQKELKQTHSVPFTFLDERLHETKLRLQERCGLPDQEWDKVKINIITRFNITTLKEDTYRLSDHHFKSDESLGLDHTDPWGRYNASATDRGLYIKD
ncbi:hypothetical protein INT47_001112 [Mucor saturninus]|uniref:ubiquitinyl hydrolase 1 n=1 Tax=Mucor saturninus TaxID=64648 RepID=A0A8H7RNP0_9FUNG|nr:hypothetical protein INT47_001112 [Mucor saturninus]